MYRDYFQLKDNPFALTPDPRFLFLSHHHREAMAHLLYGMGEMGGFVQVTGEVGTGKTTLCRSLLEQAPEQVDVALILNPKLNGTELVASICDELQVAYPAGTTSVKVLVDCLNRHLLDAHAAGRRTVLIIDEAQNLSPEVLEQVRLLTNLETSTHKLLQILLIGQPELRELMENPGLRQLSQRITARYHLTPLQLEETVAYVQHRLDVAGCHRPLFNPPALRMIHRLSGGVPRLINIICDRSLLGAYARRKLQVDKALVRNAAAEVTGEPVKPRARRLGWLAAAGVCCLVALGGWLAYRQLAPQVSREIPPAAALPQPTQATPPTAAQAQEPASGSAATADKGAAVSDSAADAPGPAREPSPAGMALQASPGSEPDEISTVTAVDAAAAPLPPSGVATAAAAKSLDAGGEPGDTREVPAAGTAMETTAAPLPARPHFGELLKSGRLATNTETAFAILFRHWGADYRQLSGATACERAKAAGLSCFHTSGNWNTLKTYNRPAVLELADDEHRLHDVVVVGMQGDEITIDVGGQGEAFPRDEIDPFWYGEFILLWKAPPAVLDAPILGKGSRGPAVQRIRYWLDRAEGVADKPEGAYSGVFDELLEKRVIRFQRVHRVIADGLVGEQTWLLLNTAAGDPPAPVLHPQAGQGERS